MISILIATYNGSTFIKEQIDSILNQTYKDYEIIVVDDCSTDKTIEIVKTIFNERRFDNYKIFINESNVGPTKTFEYGITLCNRDYIAFSDQDDIWHSKKLEKYFDRIKVDDLDLLYAPSFVMKSGEYSNIIFPSSNNYKTDFGKLVHNNARGATILIKRIVALELSPFEDLYDKWLYINCAFRYRIDKINSPLHYYRIHDSNVNGGGYRFSSKHKLLLTFQNNINFYKKLNIRFENDNSINFNKKKSYLCSKIENIIDLNLALQNALTRKNVYKIFKEYIQLVLFKDFSIEEKLIYFYYFFIKS